MTAENKVKQDNAGPGPEMVHPYRELIEHQGEGIGLVDTNEMFIFANPAAEKIFGVGRGQLLGRSIADFLDEENLETVRRMTARRLKGARDSYLLDVAAADGVQRTIRVTAVPQKNSAGKVVGAYGIFRDVTAEVSAQRQLARSEKILRAIIESTADGILVIGQGGEVLHFNSQFLRIWHIPEERARRDNDSQLLQLARKRVADPDAFLRRVQELYRSSEKAFDVFTMADGRTIERYSQPLLLEGKIMGRVWSFRDVTDYTEACRAAEQAARLKSDFVATISHEIRTPLNGILGMTQLALESGSSTELREFLEASLESAQGLRRLLDDVLDFSRLESGRLEIRPWEFSLRDKLMACVEPYSLQARQKGLGFTVEIGEEVPARIEADADRLCQVVDNLLSNALKFTSQGGIGLAVGLAEASTSGPILQVTVSDTGIGIAPEDQARVFSSFTQLDRVPVRRAGGAGLGLSICRRLVEAMGGQISVYSEPGRGSRFTFTVPVGRPTDSGEVGDRESPSTLPAASQKDHRALSPEDDVSGRVISPEEVSMKPDNGQSKLWDKARLLQRLGGDERLLDELLAVFREQTKTVVADMKEVLQKDQRRQLGRLAHSFKGACLNVELQRLAQIARWLEKNCEEAPVERLRQELDGLAEQIEKFFAKRPGVVKG